MPLKIDIHTHIMPAEVPRWADKFGYNGFVHLEHKGPGCAHMMRGDEFFREVQANTWDASARLMDCDAHHVDVQVLSTIPVLFSYWARAEHAYDVARFLNDHIAATVAEHPKRFVGLATLPMQSVDLSLKELERSIKELGLAGIEIGSHINHQNLNDSAFYPIWSLAEELGAAIFVHPWDMMGMKDMPDYWLPWLVGMPAESSRAICSMIFGGIFEKFPNLRVAFAHGGGSFPATIGRIEHGFNVRPDLCAIDNKISPKAYLGRFWLDSLVHDRKMLNYLIELVGPEKIALGTDYPFPLGELEPGKLIEEGNYNPEVRNYLMHRAALEWLDMNKEQFL